MVIIAFGDSLGAALSARGSWMSGVDLISWDLPTSRMENVLDWHDRISVDPKVLVGKPVIKGTRIAVGFVLEFLAEGGTREQILTSYPRLCADDIHAALH
jgi:uncharacterized protein (DUF433 family)